MIISNTDSRIVDHIEHVRSTDTTRGHTWWPRAGAADDRYLAWSILDHGDGIVACAAIQKFNTNLARLITRFYINPSHRGNTTYDPIQTIAFGFITEQLDFCRSKGIDHAFVSLEQGRRGVATKHQRMATQQGLECVLLDGLYATCADTHLDCCRQHICLYPLSTTRFDLEKLS